MSSLVHQLNTGNTHSSYSSLKRSVDLDVPENHFSVIQPTNRSKSYLHWTDDEPFFTSDDDDDDALNTFSNQRFAM